jgi:hypothetical protein
MRGANGWDAGIFVRLGSLPRACCKCANGFE